jgi:hypothetical protein
VAGADGLRGVSWRWVWWVRGVVRLASAGAMAGIARQLQGHGPRGAVPRGGSHVVHGPVGLAACVCVCLGRESEPLSAQSILSCVRASSTVAEVEVKCYNRH